MRKIVTSKRRINLLILLVFAGLTLLMTWPVAARISTHFAGGRDDLWVHQWTFWWLRQALREGLNPFFTPYLYHPEGVSLTSHNIAWFNFMLWLPLQRLVGHIAAYNVVFLLILILNCFAMYLFAYAVTTSRIGAFIAGLIFGFWPYTLSHYDHANMIVVFWVPLSLLFLHQLLDDQDENPTKKWWTLVAASGISIAMIGITRWQLLIMSSPLLIVYPIWRMFGSGDTLSRRKLLSLLAAAGIALLLMAPLAAPLVGDQFGGEFADDVFLDEPLWGRTDLLAYFVPSIHNGLLRGLVEDVYQNFVVNQFYTPSLGFVTLLVVAGGLIWRWQKTWLWLLLALLYMILALGPVLAINGQEFPHIPMPYGLVEDFFLLRLLRRPDRLNVFLSLPMAMMAAWGMEALLSKIHTQRARLACAALVSVLVLISYSPLPFATTQPEIPLWLKALTTEEEQFGILDLPVNDRSYDKWYMLYQMTHQKPIATGHVSRLPAEATSFLQSVPLLKGIEERDQRPDPSLTNITAELDLLHDASIRYLVIHKKFANQGLQDLWRDWLTVEPTYEDEQVIVYETDLQFGRNFSFEHTLFPEIGLLQAQASPSEAVQTGTIAVDLRWATAQAPGNDYDVCFLLMDGDRTVQKSCFRPDVTAGTATWSADEIRRANYVLPASQDIEPGAYSLKLSLAQPGTQELLGAVVPIQDVHVYANAPSQIVNAEWQNGIVLTGYDLDPGEGSLTATLYWQAPDAVGESYKVFVHLVDTQSGGLIAQSDAIPRNWTYPTDRWQPGEIVREEITLPIDNLSMNDFELRIGLYDEHTGQRVLVNVPAQPSPQEYLVVKSPTS